VYSLRLILDGDEWVSFTPGAFAPNERALRLVGAAELFSKLFKIEQSSDRTGNRTVVHGSPMS
jgi:hypothetical protein